MLKEARKQLINSNNKRKKKIIQMERKQLFSRLRKIMLFN